MTGPARPDAGLWTALALSLLVHAVALTLGPPMPRVTPFAMPPLEVRLLEPNLLPPAALEHRPVAERTAAALAPAAPASAAPASAAPARAAPTPAAPAPQHARSAARKIRDNTAVARREARPPPAPSAPPRVDDEEAAGPQASPPIVHPGGTGASGSPASSTALALAPPGHPSPSADLLSGYGKAIAQALARFKEYPRVAEMRGWEGLVTMRLRVAPTGRLIGAEVYASSGHEVLDRQALAMASRTEWLPAPPDGLRETEIAVLVPIAFRLAH